jgi:hypothetical protein
LLTVLLTAGCHDDGPGATAPRAGTAVTDAAPPTTDAALPGEAPLEVPGVTAILEQYREDEIQGLISVKTTNRSASTLEFLDLRLEWPGITSTEPLARPTRLAPGIRLDLRVRQGDAVCGDPPVTTGSPPAEPAMAVGQASIDGAATPVLVAVPIDDEDAILPRIWARSCRDQRVRWAADLRFGDTWTPTTTPAGAPAVLGTIELQRSGSPDELAITEINGSVLLRIGAVTPADPVAVLAPGDDAATIPIRVEQSGNCAAHALIESKKTFIIPIDLAIGADESLAYVIRFDDSAQRILNAMINESCGLG